MYILERQNMQINMYPVVMGAEYEALRRSNASYRLFVLGRNEQEIQLRSLRAIESEEARERQ